MPCAARPPARLAPAIAELARRQLLVDRIEAAAFEKQRAFVCDEARQSYLICPRRAGKSRGGGLRLFRVAAKFPGSVGRYVGLFRQTAKDIMWDVLKEIDDGLEIGAKFNETELKVTLPNGSSFRLVGMDSNSKELRKVLGGKLKQVIIDEAASFTVDLGALIKGFIGPATIEARGFLTMSGTPDPDEARGFFYDVTTGKESGWSRHTWDTLDNPYSAEQFREKLDAILRDDPLYMETPEFRCMYRAEWPDDPSGWVYRFNRERNLCAASELPQIDFRVIGIDLGLRDDSSIVDVGWNRHSKTLYILHAEKEKGLTFRDLAERVRAVQAMRADIPARQFVDGANAQGVLEMRKWYGLPLVATEKQDKNVAIRMMNTELICGRIKVVDGAATDLVVEWTGADETGASVRDASPLVWDKRALQRRPPMLREDPRCANHAADAALYAFRNAFPFASRPEETKPEDGTEAAMRALLDSRRAKRLREMREEEGWA